MASKTLIAVDTSGSVYLIGNKIKRVAREEAKKHRNVSYTLFDTEAGPIEKTLKLKESCRGGTDVDPVFNLAAKEKFNHVVVISDGCFPPPVGSLFDFDRVTFINLKEKK